MNNELRSHQAESASADWGKGGSVVSETEMLRRIERLELDVAELKRDKRPGWQVLEEGDDSEEVLEQWKTANLVLHAFGTFVWNLISDTDKIDLANYDMTNFLDLLHVKDDMKHTPARDVATRIYYDEIDEDMRCLLDQISWATPVVSDHEKPLEYASISDDRVRDFLENLGASSPYLQPLEVSAFDYLKKMSNSDANIQEASHVND